MDLPPITANISSLVCYWFALHPSIDPHHQSVSFRYYEGAQQMMPAGTVVRLLPSFLRFGSLQLAAARQGFSGVVQMAMNVLQTLHALDSRDDPDAAAFLRRARWLGDDGIGVADSDEYDDSEAGNAKHSRAGAASVDSSSSRHRVSSRLHYQCFYGAGSRARLQQQPSPSTDDDDDAGKGAVHNGKKVGAEEKEKDDPPTLPRTRKKRGQAKQKWDVAALEAGAQCTEFYATKFADVDTMMQWLSRRQQHRNEAGGNKGPHHSSTVELGLLECIFLRVAQRSAAMVASWMATGFVHGVMNTDNMCVGCLLMSCVRWRPPKRLCE